MSPGYPARREIKCAPPRCPWKGPPTSTVSSPAAYQEAVCREHDQEHQADVYVGPSGQEKAGGLRRREGPGELCQHDAEADKGPWDELGGSRRSAAKGYEPQGSGGAGEHEQPERVAVAVPQRVLHRARQHSTWLRVRGIRSELARRLC